MTDNSVIILNIMIHVVPNCYYERMLGEKCNGNVDAETYDDFLAWNKSCLQEQSDDDVKWVWGLCQRLNKKKIGMMDMECCCIWEADTIFYDRNKNLVIVHPR
jgi:hypothetical protein